MSAKQASKLTTELETIKSALADYAEKIGPMTAIGRMLSQMIGDQGLGKVLDVDDRETLKDLHARIVATVSTAKTVNPADVDALVVKAKNWHEAEVLTNAELKAVLDIAEAIHFPKVRQTIDGKVKTRNTNGRKVYVTHDGKDVTKGSADHAANVKSQAFVLTHKVGMRKAAEIGATESREDLDKVFRMIAEGNDTASAGKWAAHVA